MVGYTFDNSIRKCVKIKVEENITEEIPAQLFDISLSLDDILIQSADELTVVVTFESFGTIPTQINLTFIILDESGIEYAVDNDFIVVTTEEVFRKRFEALFLPDGKYTLVLQTLYNVDVFDEFRQEFEIGKERRGITGRAIDFVEGTGKWYGLGIIVIILIVWLVWWSVKKQKEYREKEQRGKVKSV